jgi:hypothetical protein
MMSLLSISFSASAACRAFILTGAYNKMSSSERESRASDMSDLSYKQDIGEVGEGGERNGKGMPIALHSNALVPRANPLGVPA